MENHILLKIFLYILLFMIPVAVIIWIKSKNGAFNLLLLISAVLLSYFGTTFLIEYVFYKKEFVINEQFLAVAPKVERIIEGKDTSFANLSGMLTFFCDEEDHYKLDAYHSSWLHDTLLPLKNAIPKYAIVYRRNAYQVGQWLGARSDGVYNYQYFFDIYNLGRNKIIYSEESDVSRSYGFPAIIYNSILRNRLKEIGD